jgi:hypothetical protein
VQLREPSALAKVEAALAVVAEQDAKAEAVLRAFEGSGAETVDAFADMYGMNPAGAAPAAPRPQLKAQA